MKKITSWSSLLLLSLFVVAFAACRHDDFAPKAGADADQPTFAMDIDLEDIPILPPEERTITSTSAEDAGGDDTKPQTARAFEFTVPAEGGGNYPKLSFRDGDKIQVRLVLYPKGYYGTKVFYSKDLVELTVKNNKVSFKMKGLEFIGGNGLNFSGNLAFNNQNKWRLTALYAPGSTQTPGNNIINFEGKSPAKFLNPGEKLVVGTDINIPFVLGVRKADGSHEPGVPVTMIYDNQKVNPARYWDPEYNNPKNYRFEYKATKAATDPEKEGFYPLGTLFAMRFSNDMKSMRLDPTQLDVRYWTDDPNGTGGTHNNGKSTRNAPTYNYRIQKVFIRSSSVKGQFDIGKSVQFAPKEITLTEFDTRTTPTDKGTALNEAGVETPWLYFWQYSAGGKENNIMEITFKLYNETLGILTQERVYRAYGQSFKGSNKYYKHLKLTRELRLSPLATLGESFVAFYPGDTQGVQWSEPWTSNSNMANGPIANAGGIYLRSEVDQFKWGVQVKDPRHPDAYREGKTWWILPRKENILGIFPPKVAGVSDIQNRAPISSIVDQSNDVIIDGIKVHDEACYTTNGLYDLRGADQKQGHSLRVYYGLRYVGTEYVSAWRYIELGPWNTFGTQGSPISSKFIMQSRLLPVSAGADWNPSSTPGTPGFWAYNETKAHDLLKNVIATNSFWSDVVPDATGADNPLTMANVTLVKPDVIQRVFPLVGHWRLGNRAEIGRQFVFWIHPNNGWDKRGWIVANRHSETLTEGNLTGNKPRAVILPILMPRQTEW